MFKKIIKYIWESANNPTWILAFILLVPVLICKYAVPDQSCSFLPTFVKWYLISFWVFYFVVFSVFVVISINELRELLQKIKEQGFVDTAREWITNVIKTLKKMPLKILFSLGLFVFFYLVIIESYLYFPVKYIYKVILGFLALYSITFIYVNPDPDREFKRKVAGGLKILGISILIFLTPISTTFKEQFLQDGETLDKYIFANAAAAGGKNYGSVMKNRMSIDVKEMKNASPREYADTFSVYLRQLKNDHLPGNLLPGKIFDGDQTVHGILNRRAFDILEEKIPGNQKQKIAENLLDYLVCVIEKKMIESINETDQEYPIEQIFFEDLEDLLKSLTEKNEFIDPGIIEKKWKKLLDTVHEYYPAINIELSSLRSQLE